jgi:hypothetical protein
MAYNGHHAVVDLTDDHDLPSPSSSNNTTRFSDHPPSSYIASAQNPAKRSRVEPPNLNLLALLNPRGYIGNGSSPSRSDIPSLPTPAQQEIDRTVISLDKRMESLHGLKDRKVKATASKEFKNEDTADSQDRPLGNNLLSKNVVNGAGSADLIDLTGLTLL